MNDKFGISAKKKLKTVKLIKKIKIVPNLIR